MTEKPKLNEGWGPALDGQEWEAYNKKYDDFLTYNQKGLDALVKIDKKELPLEAERFIQMALMSISTAKELISHMSFVRVKREKEKKKSTKGLRKGGEFAPWKTHEQVILVSIAEYESYENRIKLRSDATKITQKTARKMIEKESGLSVTESTFNTWLKKYRKNNGEVFS